MGEGSEMVVYVASPYAGDVSRNQRYLRRALRYVVDQGFTPVAPHAYLPDILDDDVREEREIGLRCGLSLINVCDEIWAFVDYGISSGMSGELVRAREVGTPIAKVTLDNLP